MMEPAETPLADEAPRPTNAETEPAARLRLYVARSTPNSVRAERNLSVALDGLRGRSAEPSLEVIDVFTQPKRAITDGVVVTPTLVGVSADKRIVLMGDLADHVHLERILQDLMPPNVVAGAELWSDRKEQARE